MDFHFHKVKGLEGKSGRKMKPEQDLPWWVGFGWIHESGKWGLV